MQEREFFSSDGVYVSLARFVVDGQTYAMSGVTSVKASEVEPSRFIPTVLGLAAVVAMLTGGVGIAWSVAFIALAVWIWSQQKSEYFVMLSTASGEVKALKSRDRAFIGNVVQALNDCIVERG